MNKKFWIIGITLVLLSVNLIDSIKPVSRISKNENTIPDECVGLVATGTCVKDNRSIFWKNRHATVDNQKPIFFQGSRYTFFGVGNIGSDDGECRMGMNEKGLAIGNFIVGDDLIEHWEYVSDHSGINSDDTMKKVLGNFSTVSKAAMWVAQHGHFGQYSGFQYGIVSAEPGVGVLVSIDIAGHSNITWVNNTYVVFANAFYCNGDVDPDKNDIRARSLVDDIVHNGTSSEGDSLINWQDVCQRLAKDTNEKEDGAETFSYSNEISGQMAYSAMVAVSGNSSYNNSLHTAWLNFGKTTQIGIFIPISATYLQSSIDIPSNFTIGNGIQSYVDVKYAYASVGANKFYCSKVREIQKYSFYNENLTFQWFDSLMDMIKTSANDAEAKAKIRTYVEHAVITALSGYANNISIAVQITKPEPGLYINNNKIISFSYLPAVVIKTIDVEATIFGAGIIEYVEFSLDGVVKTTDTNPPYMWTWNEKTLLRFWHTLRVTVYDSDGYRTSDEIIVWKFL